MGLSCYTAGWLALLAVSSAAGADVERVAISQAHAQLPAIKAYVDIVDAGGQPPAGLTPANLSALLGAQNAQVQKVDPFPGTGEGVAYVFLLDISKSISRQQFTEMRDAIQTWIAGLKPDDRAAIGTFGEEYRLLLDFTNDKEKLGAALNGLEPRDMHTRLYLAISQAVELDQRIDAGLPVRRVIVLLSDGKDEGSALTADDVLVKLRASRLPIYTIGLSRLPSQKQRYLDVLRRFSDVSGGLYEEGGSQTVAQLYAAIQQAILRVFVIRLACPGCSADGRSYPLQVTYTQGTRVLQSAALDIFAVPDPHAVVPHAPIPWWQKIPLLTWVLAGIAVLAAAGFVILRRRQAAGSISLVEAAEEPFKGLDAILHPKQSDAPKPEGMPVRFTVVAGKEAGSSHELKLQNKIVIGRASDCDLVVPDPEASNHHCELILIRGQLMVSDLGSTNNTYLNGVPIMGRHKVEPLDTIQLGDTELRVHFEET
jgi:hypothetical protein